MTPTTHPLPALLAALEARGPRPALVWYGDEGRTELSGHVLANWIIKATNHLDEEILLAPADRVVLDLPPHWKRLVVALAAWALGGEVELAGRGSVEPGMRVLATERTGSDLAGTADELLAVHPVSLSLRFTGELPALAHDWVREIRGHADQLTAPLAAWSGPEVGEDPGHTLLIDADALPHASSLLGAFTYARGIVGPAGTLTAEQVRNEGAAPT